MSQPEYRLATKISKAVKERGMWLFKVHGGPMTVAGVPDLVGVYRGLFIAFEVKMPTGVVSDRQRYIMSLIMNAQGIVTVPRSVADALAVLDRVDDAITHGWPVSDQFRDRPNDRQWRA
jgi:hypothetical protein